MDPLDTTYLVVLLGEFIVKLIHEGIDTSSLHCTLPRTPEEWEYIREWQP